MRKMREKNVKKAGKISFKFSEECNSKNKDLTGETLASLATVSSAKIVEHNFAKKRQKKVECEKTKKEDTSSLLFTDEDIEKMSKEYFLHSKNEKPKYEAWKD